MNNFLEFHSEMLTQLLEDNCLMVASKGLDLEAVLIQFIKCHSTPHNLVLVIGTSNTDEEYIIDCLQESKEEIIPKRITSEFSSDKRRTMYLEGGVFFVTSRILIVDMLLDRVPFNLITGLIVFKAHKLVDSCQEAFICRLYRMKNKKGFIKGISTDPYLLLGFSKVERIMRYLFVKKLYLWPRFHASVLSSLDSRAKPEVTEFRFALGNLMSDIQSAILRLISACVKEIAKANAWLVIDVEELTAENAISPGFDKFLRKRFQPVWHQLNPQTKKSIEDIRLFQDLLFSLTSDDCVSFYLLTKAIRDDIKINLTTPDWIFLEPAETLFSVAKKRVSNFIENSDSSTEGNAKWTTFVEVINEIKGETTNNDKRVNVLVIVNNDKTILRLKDVLNKGPEVTLKEIYEKSKETLSKQFDIDKEKNEPLELNDELITMSQHIRTLDALMSSGNLNIIYYSCWEHLIAFKRILNIFKPWYIILYDPNMAIIRSLEIYQATMCSPQKCKIYFFMYDSSCEEQKYLTSLRKEKQAFEALIETKAVMTVPEYREGREDNPDLIRETRETNITRNEVIRQTILVDMREFQASLPSMIHKRGIDILPVTIEIGDYILTPETCVERKSISDLIGSLKSGRLYNQAGSMIRHYKRAILLIEFDGSKSFSFKGNYWGVWNSDEIVSKLILLTISYPKLRLIWSPSAKFSSEVFEELKKDKEEPSIEKAEEISKKELPIDETIRHYDPEAMNVLLCLPGVTINNVYGLMRRVSNMRGLIKIGKEELQVLMGVNGEALWDALHSNCIKTCLNDIAPKGVFKKIKMK